MSGKGDKRRSTEVDEKFARDEYDRIFYHNAVEVYGETVEAESEAELYEKITGQKSSVLKETTS